MIYSHPIASDLARGSKTASDQAKRLCAPPWGPGGLDFIGAVMKTHACPGGCGHQVPRHHFACRNCWARLPADLRQPISTTYQRDPVAHMDAMADAMEWYADPASGLNGTGALKAR